MKAGLTPKQQQVFNFLRLFHKVNGYYPSVREIGLGVVDGQQVLPERSSPTSVQRYLMFSKSGLDREDAGQGAVPDYPLALPLPTIP